MRRDDPLFIGIRRAGDVVKCLRYRDSQEIVSVVIELIAILIVLERGICIGNIIQVVKEGLAHAEFERQIVFGIDDILYSPAKGNSKLNIAVLFRLIRHTRYGEKAEAGEEVRRKAQAFFAVSCLLQEWQTRKCHLTSPLTGW